jgi:hypothetical protein
VGVVVTSRIDGLFFIRRTRSDEVGSLGFLFSFLCVVGVLGLGLVLLSHHIYKHRQPIGHPSQDLLFHLILVIYLPFQELVTILLQLFHLAFLLAVFQEVIPFPRQELIHGNELNTVWKRYSDGLLLILSNVTLVLDDLGTIPNVLHQTHLALPVPSRFWRLSPRAQALEGTPPYAGKVRLIRVLHIACSFLIAGRPCDIHHPIIGFIRRRRP